MSTDALGRGRWISFHRSPVYRAECGAFCKSADGHRGYAAVGQVIGGAPVFNGRTAYTVRFWHQATEKSAPVVLECTVSVDRIIGVLRTAPPGIKEMVES